MKSVEEMLIKSMGALAVAAIIYVASQTPKISYIYERVVTFETDMKNHERRITILEMSKNRTKRGSS